MDFNAVKSALDYLSKSAVPRMRRAIMEQSPDVEALRAEKPELPLVSNFDKLVLHADALAVSVSALCETCDWLDELTSLEPGIPSKRNFNILKNDLFSNIASVLGLERAREGSALGIFDRISSAFSGVCDFLPTGAEKDSLTADAEEKIDRISDSSLRNSLDPEIGSDKEIFAILKNVLDGLMQEFTQRNSKAISAETETEFRKFAKQVLGQLLLLRQHLTEADSQEANMEYDEAVQSVTGLPGDIGPTGLAPLPEHVLGTDEELLQAAGASQMIGFIAHDTNDTRLRVLGLHDEAHLPRRGFAPLVITDTYQAVISDSFDEDQVFDQAAARQELD